MVDKFCVVFSVRKNSIVPMSINHPVTDKIIFVEKVVYAFFRFSFLTKSIKGINPTAPKRQRIEIVALTQKSNLKASKLVLKRENPAVQKADIE